MLPALHIEQTADTPWIFFDAESGKLELHGRSAPVNAAVFYDQVLDWIEGYAAEPAALTSLTLDIHYFDTSSAKHILALLKKLEAIHLTGKTSVDVTWRYSLKDPVIHEAAEDFREQVKMPFHIVN